MVMKTPLLIIVLWNTCLVPEVFGEEYFIRNGRQLKDNKVSSDYTPRSTVGSDVYFNDDTNNSTPEIENINDNNDEESGNVILNSPKPLFGSHVETEKHNKNTNKFNFGVWRILNNNRENLSRQRARDSSIRKCTSYTSNERRSGCLRKITRRKVSTEDDNVNLKVIHEVTSDRKGAFSISNNLPVVNIDNNQSTNDEESVPDDDNGKLSSKVGSKSYSCYWRQEKCGCDCEGTLNYDDFQDLSRSFFPCYNFTFTMANGEYYALPPNFFSKVKSVQDFNLFITNSTFEYICDTTPLTSPFKGVVFDNSAQIKLSHVKVRRGWNWTPFEQLKSSSGAQVKVTLENCQLRRLTSDFANLAGGQVDTIDIYNSDLQMIGSNAFKTFENMTRFRVPSNKIQQLRRTDFPQLLYKLEELDLRNNELSYLDNDLFSNMPSLKEIVLSGNPISLLPEATFQVVISKTELVGISDIPLTCDCRLQWLKDSMKRDNQTERNMQGAVCRRPPYLRGLPFDFLSKEHLICP